MHGIFLKFFIAIGRKNTNNGKYMLLDIPADSEINEKYESYYYDDTSIRERLPGADATYRKIIAENLG